MSLNRILLVDDDRNTRECLGELLELELGGVPLDTCAGAEEALRKLQSHPYGWLVTDQVMPGMTGLELTRAARSLQPDIRCCIITGQPRPAEADLGPVSWFSKPLDVEVLLRELRS
jgi:CheY-like chemotaxis protein